MDKTPIVIGLASERATPFEKEKIIFESTDLLRCDCRLTRQKTKDLINDSNYKVTGFIVEKKDGQRAIVEMGAVRHLSNREMWDLMHPQSQS